MRLRLALAAARDRLVASYPRMDVAEARPRVPSFYALELPRAVQGSLPELKKFEQLAREGAPARLNWPAPPESGDAIDDAEYDLVMLGRALSEGSGARYVLEVNPHVARSLRARWKRWASKWTEADGLITNDPAALAALSEHRLSARPWSPSSLQQFATCPYKFALHGIHGLRPREEPMPIEQMDPLTRGGLFHAVQFALLGELRSRALLPVNGDRLPEVLRLADLALDRMAAQYEEDLVPAIPRVWRTEIEDLRTDLRGWLQHIAVHDDDWEPMRFEFAFGLSRAEGHDPASTGEEADLRECGVRLRGSIDLVERNVARSGVLRITDHKTGKPPESIPAYVGGGRFLQPLLYGLAAEQLLGATVETGRLFYATQQGGYLQVVIPTSETARRFLSRLLSNIDQAIVEGFLPPALPEGRLRHLRLPDRVWSLRGAARGPPQGPARRTPGAADGNPRNGVNPAARPASDEDARSRIRKSLGESLIVEASAGTGKTTELVRRIVAVLEQGLTKIDCIAAVTFTNKAAGELKLRLREELDRARRDAPVLEDALKRLEEASIGTIHSFCAQILRERPVEARVDPDFEELAEREGERLYQRAFRAWLERRLGESSPGLRRAFARLAWRDSWDDTPPVEQLQWAGRKLVEWRDYSAPWRREPFARAEEIDTITRQARELAAMSANPRRVTDNLYTHLAPARSLAGRIDRAENAGPRDYDALESLVLKLGRDLRDLKKGSGRVCRRGRTRGHPHPEG